MGCCSLRETCRREPRTGKNEQRVDAPLETRGEPKDPAVVEIKKLTGILAWGLGVCQGHPCPEKPLMASPFFTGTTSSSVPCIMATWLKREPGYESMCPSTHMAQIHGTQKMGHLGKWNQRLKPERNPFLQLEPHPWASPSFDPRASPALTPPNLSTSDGPRDASSL